MPVPNLTFSTTQLSASDTHHCTVWYSGLHSTLVGTCPGLPSATKPFLVSHPISTSVVAPSASHTQHSIFTLHPIKTAETSISIVKFPTVGSIMTFFFITSLASFQSDVCCDWKALQKPLKLDQLIPIPDPRAALKHVHWLLQLFFFHLCLTGKFPGMRYFQLGSFKQGRT